MIADTILGTPIIASGILLVLSLGDILLGKIASNQYKNYTSKYIEYQSANLFKTSQTITFYKVLLKIIPAILILIIWLTANSSSSPISLALYWMILGFSLSLFLIIDLRHLESIIVGRLYKNFQGILSGKLSIGSKFSLGQSSAQILTLLVIMLIVTFFNWHLFYIGATLAPLSLILRNLFLMKS